MGLSHIHVVHKHPKRTPEQLVEKRADASTACTTGFYISPQMGATVDSLQALPITWNTTCLTATTATTKEIDIYLYSPGSKYPRIHVWEGVDSSPGTYKATLMPRWWNATASQSLQISIVPAGQPAFMSSSYFPGGPVFTATYSVPASGTPASADVTQVDSGITQVNAAASQQKATSSGKKAAAALIPLLFVFLCIGAYIKMKRSRNVDKRKRWTEAVDKRMSTISTDWKSVSAAGANAAIRNSMAVGARNSAFNFGALRPSSTIAVEGEDAHTDTDKRPMSQLRTGVGLRNPAALSSTERVSRVSFAPDTRVSRVSFADSRPSGESRRTRAFHSAYIPPVPALPDHAQEEEAQEDMEDNESDGHNTSGSFSPRQTQGALTLTPEDIRSRIAAGKARNAAAAQEKDITEKEIGLADMIPALSMMRTGGTDPSGNDDLLFPTPASPPPSYPKASSNAYATPMTSPVMAAMPMQPMPASVMSPDEMLRAYAERKKSMAMATAGGKGGLTGASISYPMPVASSTTPMPSNNNNMRVLYNAATGNISPTNTGSMATEYTPSEYSAAEAYTNNFGTTNYQQQQYPFGHHPNGSIGVGAYGGAQYAIGDDEDDSSVMGRSGGHSHEYDMGHAHAHAA